MKKGKIYIDSVIGLTDFERKNARTKEAFNLKTDKEVAQLIGITPQSFNMRKKNNNFPIQRLKEIVELNPKYHDIDLSYILTGKTIGILAVENSDSVDEETMHAIREEAMHNLDQLPDTLKLRIFDIISAFHSQNALLKYYELKASKHVNDNEQEE
ncbi:MAG: bacteriophage CI repressor [Alcaligenaceae bacterium]|jgi:hypothetical protein|nr:bacteriophage CI repressor [Alcaligenaceae bacterium]